MSDFIKDWFQWFEQGIDMVEQKEKEKFFQACGKNCVESGIINLYKETYHKAGEDLDTFFTRLNESEYIGSKVIVPGKVYEISYSDCYCDLYTKGYIQSDVICECSRQSILYVMKTLKPELEYKVDKLTAVISGDEECRFRITIQYEHR